MTLCVTTEARDAAGELAGVFCAGFLCRARFTFITFVAAELKAATSKP